MGKIPAGYRTITPHIVVADGNKAIKLYEKALGAKLLGRMDMPGTKKIMHGIMELGNSKFFLMDANPAFGASAPDKEVGARFYVYVKDVDKVHAQAVKAGMKELSAPEDMFWGDRTSVLEDPFGHRWTLATQVKEVSEAEMAAAMKQMAG